ncbi:ANTAR domain-containing protein [Arthrobacter sp. SLBN-100]|uniref:GAF and ANTAR domain-containing protein n=1 Tax=Arthrobacter sp. SLBN-100 TaxID=2768450 RepID=UPI00114F15DB|nr:GAF and ANTAR domain-containing protein [Arthrobacter sp. SLBN-100]TQJ67664.1 ANTAR domain-containing protein [Arthrobacter sp. SLBN-100]
MEIELRPKRAHPQTGAADGTSGAACFRGRSTPPPAFGILLDLRACSDEASLQLLSLAAASALSELAGCTLDCTVSLVRPGQAALVSGTSSGAIGLAQADQSSGDGPVSRALAGHLAVIVNSYSADPRWPSPWHPLTEAGYRSLLSVPLHLQAESMSALTLLAPADDVFAPGVIIAASAFSKLGASSYLSAAELRAAQSAAEHLQTALQGRTSIDVACGVIMGQNRCSYRDAFHILAQASSHRNVKARVVAETMLQQLPGGAPSTHFTE